DVHIDSYETDGERYQRMGFDRLEHKIDVAHIVNPTQARRAREMPLAELREIVARIAPGSAENLRDEPATYASHLDRRYALPADPAPRALLARVGVPRGMQRKRGSRSSGVILCAVLAFGYYALQSFCESLAIEEGFPPRLAMWLPNVAFAVVGLALLVHARRSSGRGGGALGVPGR